METWEVKKTPIPYLWEIARFTPISLIKDIAPNPLTQKVLDLVDYLHVSHYISNGWRPIRSRSESVHDANNWHTDASPDFNATLLLIAGKYGTEFKNSLEPEGHFSGIVANPDFISDAWTLYLMPLTLVHRQPQYKLDDIRYMIRIRVRLTDEQLRILNLIEV